MIAPKRTKRNRIPGSIGLAAVVSLVPLVAQAGPAGGSGSSKGVRGIAEAEIARRQALVEEAQAAILRGDEIAAQGDFEGAISEYRSAIDLLPEAPLTEGTKDIAFGRYADTSVQLARQRANNGRYDDATALLDGVLEIDPDHVRAGRLLDEIADPEIFNRAMTPEYVGDVQSVSEGLQLANSFYELGQYDKARKSLHGVLLTDRYNSAARQLLTKIENEIDTYLVDARAHTRGKLLGEVDAAWETNVPSSALGIVSGGGGGEAAGGKKAIGAKLASIIVPKVQFIDATVEEAVEFLRLRSRDLDMLETNPEEKGVNIILKSGAAGDGAQRISLDLTNVPLAEALRYITDMAGLKYKVEPFAVVVVPITDVTNDLYTRTFRVPPDFLSAGGGDGGGEAAIDPFAPAPAAGSGGSISARKSAREILEERGVNFPDGASAFFNPTTSQLIIRNTQGNIELIEAFVLDLRDQIQRQIQISTRFVEVQQTNLDELGFDWLMGPLNFGGEKVFGTGGVTGNGVPTTAGDFAFNQPGTTTPIGGNPLSKGLRFGSNAIDINAIDSLINADSTAVDGTGQAPGIFALSGIFTDPQFQVIIRTLSQKKGVDLMSAPSVVTRSGQRAKVEVIREFIYPTEFDPPEIPEQVGDDVVTIGGEAPQQSSSFPVTPTTPTAFETRSVGVTMEVDPVIGSDGFTIDLNLAPEVVEFEGFVNYGSPIKSAGINGQGQAEEIVLTENRIEQPVFSSRKINTAVTIWDGQTVAIGGLMREDVQSVEDKIPFLGDLPGIGRLFQTKADQHFKRNLMIFVSARMIDPSGTPIRSHEQLKGQAAP